MGGGAGKQRAKDFDRVIAKIVTDTQDTRTLSGTSDVGANSSHFGGLLQSEKARSVDRRPIDALDARNSVFEAHRNRRTMSAAALVSLIRLVWAPPVAGPPIGTRKLLQRRPSLCDRFLFG